MGWIVANLRLVMIVASLVGLGGVYYYWKDSIEDALLAQVQLQAMKDAEVFKQKRYAEAQKIIKQQAESEQALLIWGGKLALELERKADEDSCLRKPLTASDVRLLNRLLTTDSTRSSANSND